MADATSLVALHAERTAEDVLVLQKPNTYPENSREGASHLHEPRGPVCVYHCVPRTLKEVPQMEGAQ